MAIGLRRSTAGKSLLARWAAGADNDLATAAWAGLAMYGEPIATAKLAALANQKGAATEVDRLLSYVVPPTAPSPRRRWPRTTTRCGPCGRSTSEVDSS